jgi:hypothetical protein
VGCSRGSSVDIPWVFRWKGGGPRTNSSEALEKLQLLKSDIDDLENEEHYLDEQIKIMNMNKKILLEDQSNRK